MSRQAKLRDKNGWWATDVGGTTTRFGKVAEVPYKVALKEFREYLARPRPERPKEKAFTVGDLATRFQGWVLEQRGNKAYRERSRHIRRFLAKTEHLPATEIGADHLERFIEALTREGFSPDYIDKHVVSVRAMFAKAARKAWVPASFRPFSGVEPIRKEPKALTEEKLPAGDEIRRLFEAADADHFGQMGDLLRVYHATGARTGELIQARAGDYQPASRAIVLAKHKRAHSLRQPIPRTITLNATAREIIARRTEGLAPEALIFPRPIKGDAYCNLLVARRFQVVRERAKVRKSITIYSFRHLWISEALMSGVDAMLVGRMAGTSVAMIERVYGHFRNQSYQEAQARLDASRNSVH